MTQLYQKVTSPSDSQFRGRVTVIEDVANVSSPSGVANHVELCSRYSSNTLGCRSVLAGP
jgi:hypothetical protein